MFPVEINQSKQMKQIKQKKQIKLRKIKSINYKYEELIQLEANNLKEANNRDISKLKTAIINSNFSFPFYIWERYIIDGAQRLEALKQLKDEGYKLPTAFPVLLFEAEDLEEAKKLVLQASSKHGLITEDSYNFFIEDIKLNITDLDSISIDLDKIDLKIKDQNEDKATEGDQSGEVKGINLKSVYQVVIDCIDELEQERVSRYLEEGGYSCRILSL